MIKPNIYISSCLLGEMVRYDGNHKRSDLIVNQLQQHFNTLSICPEVGCGMAVPRPPISLVQAPASIEIREVAPPHRDHSSVMRRFADDAITSQPQLCGFISKSKSPSCAQDDTPIKRLELNGQLSTTRALSAGFFTRWLKEHIPFVPMIDERQIEQQEERHRFFLHSFTLARFYETLKQQPDNGLRLFHHRHRGLLLALSPNLFKELSARLELVSQAKQPLNFYLKVLGQILTSPFNVEQAFAALEKSSESLQTSQRSALRLIIRSLQRQDRDQWISLLFFQHLATLINQFKLEGLTETPLFMPYSSELLLADI